MKYSGDNGVLCITIWSWNQGLAGTAEQNAVQGSTESLHLFSLPWMGLSRRRTTLFSDIANSGATQVVTDKATMLTDQATFIDVRALLCDWESGY